PHGRRSERRRICVISWSANCVTAIHEVLAFRGTAARAAPAELAELTLNALIPAGKKERHRSEWRDTSTHFDTDCVPASPAQVPCFERLTAAPEQGLRLVRKLVDHAVATRTRRAKGVVKDELTLKLRESRDRSRICEAMGGRGTPMDMQCKAGCLHWR